MAAIVVRGDSRSIPLAEKSVQAITTSPPYYRLRDYGDSRQIGMEKTPGEFIAELVAVFRECRRVLRDDGLLFVVIADTYANDAKWGGKTGGNHAKGLHGTAVGRTKVKTGVRPKSLIGIPWRLAFALMDDGWILRSEIVWSKVNAMPESVKDRPSRCHESIFMFSKQPRYFYDSDAVRQKHARSWGASNGRGLYGGRARERPNKHNEMPVLPHPSGANLKSVWSLTNENLKEKHFAAYPTKLVRTMISAATSERGACPACRAPYRRIVERDRLPTRPGSDTKVSGRDSAEVGNRDPQRHVTATRTVGWEPGCSCDAGDPVPCVVFDPFLGSGTTAVAATHLGRDCIGVELSAEYVQIARRRIAKAECPHRGEMKAKAKAVAPLAGQQTLFDR